MAKKNKPLQFERIDSNHCRVIISQNNHTYTVVLTLLEDETIEESLKRSEEKLEILKPEKEPA